jgi:hypothetical protein
MSVLLLCVAVLLFWPNTRSGIQYGEVLRGELGSLERQMKNGVPPYLLIHEHRMWLHPNQQLLSDYFPMLRTARIGAFEFLKENPAFQELAVPLHPAALEYADWQEPTAYTRSSSASIEFRIPTAPYAAGIRVRYTIRNADGTLPFVTIRWRGDQQSSYIGEHYYQCSPTGDHANWQRGSRARLEDPETEMTIWVCDRVAGIRFEPDFKPCEFRISHLALLLP